MAIEETPRGITLRAVGKAVVFGAAIALLIGASVSCGRVSESGQKVAVGAEFAFGQRIGWLHGACLAISDPNLTHGTPVALVITGEPQNVKQTQIQERANSPAKCQALMEGRGTMNAKSGMSFYELETGSVSATEMGF